MNQVNFRIVLALTAVLSGCQDKLEQGAEPKALNLTEIALKGCPRAAHSPKQISLTELTSTPERYEGVFVVVSGHYFSGFERSALFPSSEGDPYLRDTRSGVWLLQMNKSLSGEHVKVSGVFSARTKGHLGQWPGSICVLASEKVREQ